MAKAKQPSHKPARRRSSRPLSSNEIEGQQVSELPEREAMSLVNANLAVPINIAAALNVLSDGSVAGAIADQTTPIDQST